MPAFCQRLSRFIQPTFAREDLDHIVGLLEQYMGEYVEEKGGVEKLKLLTTEEMDELWEEEVAETFRLIVEYNKRPRWSK